MKTGRNTGEDRCGDTLKYLDSNVFIYPVLYEGMKAQKAKAILEGMVDGTKYATAALTMDEVLRVVSRRASRRKAIQVGMDILELPNLRILDVSGLDTLKAIELMEEHIELKPRDAIHAAVCLNNKMSIIVSDDDDFDNVDGIAREMLA